MAFLAVLLAPLQLAAQEQLEQRDRKEHHRYKRVDLGTFGGLNGYLPEPSQAIRALNNRGVVAGGADTSTADPFCLNADCLVSHTFRWQNGVLTDLGALNSLQTEAQRLALHRIMEGFRGRMWYRRPIPAHGTAQ